MKKKYNDSIETGLDIISTGRSRQRYLQLRALDSDSRRGKIFGSISFLKDARRHVDGKRCTVLSRLWSRPLGCRCLTLSPKVSYPTAGISGILSYRRQFYQQLLYITIIPLYHFLTLDDNKQRCQYIKQE